MYSHKNIISYSTISYAAAVARAFCSYMKAIFENVVFFVLFFFPVGLTL